MNADELAMLAVGQIIAAGMFSLGVLVGCSLNRKDSKDENGDKTEKGGKGGGVWHRVERR